MKILIIGGTLFVGRHLVEAALAQGHEVTLFNRGQHNPDLFPTVEKLCGDRDGGLEVLDGRRWDVVVDTCGYVPRIVRASAERLADSVARYVFISTISVYRDFSVPDQDETAPLGTIAEETREDVTGETYGPLKVLCEQVVEETMPGRVLILRPGLIVGPHDPTDRFTYWPRRIAQGGTVLAPGDPDQRVQFIDARDLAEWTVRLIENQTVGIFNAITAAEDWTMGRLLADCRAAAESDTDFTWIDETFLLEHGVAPWSDLPLWLAQGATDDYRGMNSISAANAVAAGLTYRPLVETVRETLAWDRTRPAGTPFRGGPTRERERELLQTWEQSTVARQQSADQPNQSE